MWVEGRPGLKHQPLLHAALDVRPSAEALHVLYGTVPGTESAVRCSKSQMGTGAGAVAG